MRMAPGIYIALISIKVKPSHLDAEVAVKK